MDKLDAMQAFTRVVTTGSFAEAGRKLGLTRSAVSKAVAELEHLLGAERHHAGHALFAVADHRVGLAGACNTQKSLVCLS